MEGSLVVVKEEREPLRVEYHPHRCHSVVCPICGYYESRERFKKVEAILRKVVDLGKPLVFITLTTKPYGEVEESVEESFRFRSRIYNTSLSQKLLEKLRKEIVIEFYRFGKALKRRNKGRYRERIRKEKRRIREFLSWISLRIEEVRAVKSGKKVRIRDIFNSIWKFETHKTELGWHSHWHIIADIYIPKAVLNAFWRYITKGRGEITDIRRLRGKKAISELVKYETKPVNSKLTDLSRFGEERRVVQTNGVELGYEEIFRLELSLWGRKKLVVWGDWKEIKPEEEREKRSQRLYLFKAWVGVKSGRMWHLPRAIRLAKRTGKEVYLGECEIDLFGYVERIGPSAEGRFEGDLYATPSGSVVVKVKGGEEIEEWFEEVIWLLWDWYKPPDPPGGKGDEDLVRFYEEWNSDGMIRERLDL